MTGSCPMMRGQASGDASFLVPWCLLSTLCKLSVSRLILESDSLTITDVSESDAGVYTCVTNTTLDQDSASAELTVVGKLDPRSFTPPSSRLSFTISRLIAGAFASRQQHKYLIDTFSWSETAFILTTTALFHSRAHTRQRPRRLQRSSTVKPAAHRNTCLVLSVWMFLLKHASLESVRTFPSIWLTSFSGVHLFSRMSFFFVCVCVW